MVKKRLMNTKMTLMENDLIITERGGWHVPPSGLVLQIEVVDSGSGRRKSVYHLFVCKKNPRGLNTRG